jgi:hypothetical protein
MIIINRLTTLHRTQVDMVRKSKETLQRLYKDIGDTYAQIDSIVSPSSTPVGEIGFAYPDS